MRNAKFRELAVDAMLLAGVTLIAWSASYLHVGLAVLVVGVFCVLTSLSLTLRAKK